MKASRNRNEYNHYDTALIIRATSEEMEYALDSSTLFGEFPVSSRTEKRAPRIYEPAGSPVDNFVTEISSAALNDIVYPEPYDEEEDVSEIEQDYVHELQPKKRFKVKAKITRISRGKPSTVDEDTAELL